LVELSSDRTGTKHPESLALEGRVWVAESELHRHHQKDMAIAVAALTMSVLALGITVAHTFMDRRLEKADKRKREAMGRLFFTVWKG